MALLVQIVIKVSIVLLTAWGLTRLMSRSSAAARHLVWTVAIVAALAVPLAAPLVPAWKLAVLGSVPDPAPARPGPGRGQSTEQSVSTPSVDATQLAVTEPVPVAVDAVEVADPATEVAPAGSAAPAPANWAAIGSLAWLAITLLAIGRLVAGLLWVSWTTKHADDVTDEGWLRALDAAAAALNVTRPVSLRTSARTTIPVACGIWQPTVLLPLTAVEWSDERRRIVLLHEMAHVARRDCLTQALAQLARAVYWFNPLVHLAAVRLRAEQERACDDLVIGVGTSGALYADHLLELARSFCAERFPAWATLAMARPSQLEGRVVAILDDRCNRRPPERRARVAMAAAAAALILPISALQLTAATTVASGPAETQLAQDDALIDPNPILPKRDVVAEVDATPLAAASGFDAIVTAAAQMVDVLPHFDFDLDLAAERATSFSADGSFNADADQKPDPDPDPTQKFFLDTTPKTTGDAILKLNGVANVQVQVQPQAQSGDTTVTDETRRRVADALITALNDENAEVRSEALSALASMRDARAIPGLLKALGDPTASVRQRALTALSQFTTPEAVAGIVGAMKDSNAEVRSQAIRQVNALISRGALRDANYTDLLIGLLRDASPDVRQQAIAALGNSRRREVIPSLLPLLKDGTIEVRERAAQALGTIADPSAIDALTAALRDADAGVREQAARALGQIARGQRRGTVPGFPAPLPAAPPTAVPPVPPGRPSALNIPNVDIDMLRLNADALRAHEDALRAQADELRRSMATQMNSPEFRRSMEEIQRAVEEVQRELNRNSNNP